MGMVRLFVDPDIRPLVLDIMALHAAAAKRVAGSDPLVAAYARLWKRLSQGWLPSQDHLLWRLGTEIVSARVRRHYEQTREEEESGPSPDRLVWTVDEVLDAYARQETQEGESPGPESRVPDMSEPLIVPPR